MARFWGRRDHVLYIEGSELHHLKEVLRLKPGDRVEVIAEGVFSGLLSSIDEDQAVIEEYEEIYDAESPIQIELVVALGKGEKMDWIIQKATELGVTRIVPLLTKRVVVEWNEKKVANKLLRWRKIAQEACKQCRRRIVPTISSPQTIKELEWPLDRLHLLCYEKKGSPKKLTTSRVDAVRIIIGPEGGFTDEEIIFFDSCPIEYLGLGPRILRMETAALSALTLCQYRWGDMGHEKS